MLTETSKGLRIIGADGARLVSALRFPAFEVVDLPAHQAFVLHNFEIVVPAGRECFSRRGAAPGRCSSPASVSVHHVAGAAAVLAVDSRRVGLTTSAVAG
ncbi:MAG: hypothetical protein AAF628_20800 [Planctomycetota bacterium]